MENKRKGEEKESDAKKPRIGKRDVVHDPDLHLCVEYEKNVFKDHEKLFERIMKEVEFEVAPVKVYGKTFPEPRMTALHGDYPENSYTYAKKKRYMKEMTPVLKEIQERLKEKYEKDYDFVLVNLYRDGADKVGWHSDKEDTMDITDIISISLGAERKFRMERISDKALVFDEFLEPGSIVRMKGECQKLYRHEVSKQKHADPRINLTYRISKNIPKK